MYSFSWSFDILDRLFRVCAPPPVFLAVRSRPSPGCAAVAGPRLSVCRLSSACRARFGRRKGPAWSRSAGPRRRGYAALLFGRCATRLGEPEGIRPHDSAAADPSHDATGIKRFRRSVPLFYPAVPEDGSGYFRPLSFRSLPQVPVSMPCPSLHDRCVMWRCGAVCVVVQYPALTLRFRAARIRFRLCATGRVPLRNGIRRSRPRAGYLPV